MAPTNINIIPYIRHVKEYFRIFGIFVMVTFLDNIKTLCAERGISIRQLEQGCGLAPRYVYKWNAASPGIDKVVLVADYFGVSIDELIGRKVPALSKSERMLLDLMDQLNEDGQGAALAMLQGLAQQPGYIKSDRAEKLGA